MISNINEQSMLNTAPYSIKNKNEDNLGVSKNDEIHQIKQKQDIVENNLRNCKVFGENFELKGLIDSGSESKVYKIYNKKNKKEYAIKHIIMESERKKKENELKIASKMKQKNIIIFHGYTSLLDDENFNCIIMENAKYGNLRNFQTKVLKRPFLSESMLCFLFSQVLNGLIYLHRCKVAHMDIKPQNIVIDEFLNAKLIDFSISINYKDKEPDDEIKLKFKGTNFYMPLEIHDEETIKYKDLNKIDAYALGITLYNLAYGCYPFDLTREDSKDYDSIFKKINGKLKFKNDFKLSSYFRDFISKLLEKDINKRMSIYEAARHPWIKGAEIIMMEKEKMYNISPFVVNLMTNNIKKFNDFLDM